MGIFKKRTPAPTIFPALALGHPGTLAFIRELQGGDHAAALRRYRALPTGGLREFFVFHATTEASLDNGQAALPAWCEAFVATHPEESLAWTMRGAMGITAGWHARGGGRSETVETSAWDVFFAFLNDADTDLRRAAALDPSDPVPWSKLVVAARGLQIPKEELLMRFEEATQRAPDLYAAHTQALQGLCAKWSGSHDEMFAFARTQAAASPVGSPRHALVVLAHIEQWLALRCRIHEYFPGAPTEEIVAAARNSVLAPTFLDDDDHPVAASARNVFAAGFAACDLKREAHEQALLIGTRLQDSPWSYFGNPAERLAYVLHRPK